MGEIDEVFKRYDLRGSYPSEIDESFSMRLGRAFGSSFRDETIVLGRDNVESSLPLKFAFSAGALSAGASIIDVGVGPTDFVSFCCRRLKADAGVMVTASHLGFDKAGFKFLYGEGNGFLNGDLARVKAAFLKQDFGTRKVGSFSDENEMAGAYLASAKNLLLKLSGGKKRPGRVKVVVDTLGAARIAPLLESLGCEVVAIKREKRHADCAEEGNVAYLKEEMEKHGAEVAVASDTDGDRLAVFSKGGRWVTGDEMFCFFASKVARRGRIIASVDTSSILESVVPNAKIIYTRIGDPFVIDAVIKHKAILAGEPNGHYCFPAFAAYNSGTFFAALAAMCAKEELPEFLGKLPKRFVEKKKVTVKNKDAKMKEVLEFARLSKKSKIISRLDGIKFRYCESITVLVRQSGTEDAIRITVESGSARESKAVLEELSGLLLP